MPYIVFTLFNCVGPVRKMNKTDIEVKVDGYFLPWEKKNSFSTPHEPKNSRERATKAFAGWIWAKRGQIFQISWQNWPPFTKISHHSEGWRDCLCLLAMLKQHNIVKTFKYCVFTLYKNFYSLCTAVFVSPYIWCMPCARCHLKETSFCDGK